MKSKRKFLREFIQEKHDTIKEETGIDYFIKEDWEWFENLEFSDIDYIYIVMISDVYYDKYISDVSICPNCILEDCEQCNYRKNHDHCSNLNSTYRKICGRIDEDEPICKILGDENAINFFKWNKNI